MKSINVFLGITAVLCAAVTAFASVNSQSGRYVHIRYAGQSNFVCSTISGCNNLTNNPCIVSVDGILASVYSQKSGSMCSNIVNTSIAVPPINKPGTVEEATLED